MRAGTGANLAMQSCSGISFKSQALYLFVYVTRYLGMPPPMPPTLSKAILPSPKCRSVPC